MGEAPSRVCGLVPLLRGEGRLHLERVQGFCSREPGEGFFEGGECPGPVAGLCLGAGDAEPCGFAGPFSGEAVGCGECLGQAVESETGMDEAFVNVLGGRPGC